MDLFPERLKAARSQANLTQHELAKMMTASPAIVSLWEMGDRNINHKDLYRLCQALDVSADWLLGLTKE